MKIATWNIERLKHQSDMDKILRCIEEVSADILVLTESDMRAKPEYAYCYHTPLLAELQPDYYGKTENRVSIYTRYPCIDCLDTYDNRTALCVELETGFGRLTVYGTIIGIFGNREKSFKTDLTRQMEDIRKLAAKGKNICVIGDYNLTFCDNYYYTKFGRETVEDTFRDCGIGILTRDRKWCIDHIAISDSFIGSRKISIEEWNYEKALSDHKGTVAEIV